MQLLGRRFDTARWTALSVADGVIADMEPVDDEDVPERFAAQPPWLAPGLVDLQVNGIAGHGFTNRSLTGDQIGRISRAMADDGVTAYCPTLTTHSPDVLAANLRAIDVACNGSPLLERQIVGIHLEGPYVSPENGPRGAHPVRFCRPPDEGEFSRLQEAAGGRIRIVTLSPEYENAPAFVRRLTETGVVAAIGHTAADSDQIRAAVDAGARLSTHLGNGSHGRLRRFPNYLWDQLADDRLCASLIVDGHHLPPEVVRTFVRAKMPERCLLVSDVTQLAGLPRGRYNDSGLGEVDVLADGRLVVAGQTQFLAGASLPPSVGIPNVMRFAGLALATAVGMATTAPARLLGIDEPELAVGRPADVIQFHLPGAKDAAEPLGQLSLRAVLHAGRVVAGSPILVGQ